MMKKRMSCCFMIFNRVEIVWKKDYLIMSSLFRIKNQS